SAEVGGNTHGEDPRVTTRWEAGRLHAVELGGLDVVVRAQGHLQRIPLVSVEVPEGVGVAAVGVLVPPLEPGGDEVTPGWHRSELELLSSGRNGCCRDEQNYQTRDDSDRHFASWLEVLNRTGGMILDRDGSPGANRASVSRRPARERPGRTARSGGRLPRQRARPIGRAPLPSYWSVPAVSTCSACFFASRFARSSW